MYRVAVIQNESEMLRSGYTNVLPKLRKIEQSSKYSFELFTCVNINKLFQPGDSYLDNFDSLFVTTNATSDISVLKKLQENKDTIESFITSGKGLFISSQKKLSTNNFDPKGYEGKTRFLPDSYEFFTVERPKTEKDSGIGKVSTYKNEEHILLQYPKKISAEETMSLCEHNEFKKHYYRSHIVPTASGSYIPVFVDTSYRNVSSRNLLMVNLIPQNGERVVISTIALDWEFHEKLLTNIILYITEGLPKVAFIDNANLKHGDFDFLLTSAKLSKIPHEIYDDVTKIKKELFSTHNTYIFSPDWNDSDITGFLKATLSSATNDTLGKKSYIRVYYFKEVNDILTLTQYSNFSTIDLIIDSSVLWITSMFPGSMWGKSFWITYDILTMLYDIGIDVETYISPVFKDIKNHYKEFSYDGVLGATCGLFELLFQLEKQYKKTLIKEKIKSEDFNGILEWIIEKYDSQTLYDQQTVILTLHKYRNELLNSDKYSINKEKYLEMLNTVSNSFYTHDLSTEKYSEIDLCRNISICLACGNKDTEIIELLRGLKTNQSPTGRWTNTGRTAHVLVFLLKNLTQLRNTVSIDTNTDINIDDLIYNGILFLRSEYNWKNANWDDDIQATAKAIHAIGLYNKQYKYSTQDFFKALEVESDKIYSATVIHNVSESMRRLRQQSNEMLVKIEELTEGNLNKEKEISENKEKIDALELYESQNISEVKRFRTIAAISGTLLAGVILFLGVKYPARILLEIQKLDIWGIILGFIVALVMTGVAQKTVLRSDLISRKKLEEKNLDNNKLSLN